MSWLKLIRLYYRSPLRVVLLACWFAKEARQSGSLNSRTFNGRARPRICRTSVLALELLFFWTTTALTCIPDRSNSGLRSRCLDRRTRTMTKG